MLIKLNTRCTYIHVSKDNYSKTVYLKLSFGIVRYEAKLSYYYEIHWIFVGMWEKKQCYMYMEDFLFSSLSVSLSFQQLYWDIIHAQLCSIFWTVQFNDFQCIKKAVRPSLILNLRIFSSTFPKTILAVTFQYSLPTQLMINKHHSTFVLYGLAYSIHFI